MASLLTAIALDSWDWLSLKGRVSSGSGWVLVKPSSGVTTWSIPKPRIQLCRIQHANTSFTYVLYGWKGLLSRIRNLFVKAPKVLSIVTLRDECLRLKSSFALVGWFLFPYSVKWYLTPL